MLILLDRLRPLACYALLFWFSRFNLAFGGPLEGPGTPKKTVLVLYGERLSTPGARLTEEGLSAALSSTVRLKAKNCRRMSPDSGWHGTISERWS